MMREVEVSDIVLRAVACCFVVGGFETPRPV